MCWWPSRSIRTPTSWNARSSWWTCAQAKAEGRIAPVASVVDCDMIVTMHTSRDPARAFVDQIMALEGQDGILSISIAHGFAWGDVPEMGTKVLVYSDANADPGAAKGKALARQLADELIGLREALNVPYPGIDAVARRGAGLRRRPGGAGRRRRQPRRRRGGRLHLHPEAAARARHRQRLPRPAVGPGRGAHRLRRRRRRDADAAHRRQDRPAVGRPAGPEGHRQGAAGRTCS